MADIAKVVCHCISNTMDALLDLQSSPISRHCTRKNRDIRCRHIDGVMDFFHLLISVSTSLKQSKVMLGSSSRKMYVNPGKWSCGVCGKVVR